MNVVLVHNPGAWDETHSREGLCAIVESAGHEVTYRSTRADWATGLDAVADLVVAAGGDGTVRKVCRRLAATTVPVTVLPLGTANNVARSLGVADSDLASVVTGWADGDTRALDLPLVTLDGSETRIVESSGAGLFADVIELAGDENFAAGVDDKRHRGLLALRALLTGEVPSSSLLGAVSLDGHPRSEEEVIGIEVLNTRETGPNLCLAPDADPGDGELDVVLVRTQDRDALSAYVEALLCGEPATPPHLAVRRSRRVHWNLGRAQTHVDAKLRAPRNASDANGTVTAACDGERVTMLLGNSSP